MLPESSLTHLEIVGDDVLILDGCCFEEGLRFLDLSIGIGKS